MKPVFHRVVLKLSGEALGVSGRLFDMEKFDRVAAILDEACGMGVEVAVVIGGGNVWRGRDAADMDVSTADQIGMLSTMLNCLCMRDALRRLGRKATVFTAIDMPRVARVFSADAARKCLRRGGVALLACGLGNPCFSTDTAVALRAVELSAEVILMAKNVDGVYEADPATNPGLSPLADLTYEACVAQNLKAIDLTAAVLLMEKRFPLVRVFSLDPPENILEALCGSRMGTFLHPEEAS